METHACFNVVQQLYISHDWSKQPEFVRAKAPGIIYFCKGAAQRRARMTFWLACALYALHPVNPRGVMQHFAH